MSDQNVLALLLGFGRLLIEPFGPALKCGSKGLEDLCSEASLLLHLAPRAEILFGVLTDLRFETLLLNGMFVGQVIMLADEGKYQTGQIAFEALFRHELLREPLGRLQQRTHRHFHPGVLIADLRMIESRQVALDRCVQIF